MVNVVVMLFIVLVADLRIVGILWQIATTLMTKLGTNSMMLIRLDLLLATIIYHHSKYDPYEYVH